MQNLLKLFVFFIFFLATSLNALTVTKTYSGPSPVQVDGASGGGLITVPLNTVTFSGSDFYTGATITKVTASIDWTKTDRTCANPRSGNAYHNEVFFRLDAPVGLGSVTLANLGTWSGGVDIGTVTTVFDQAAGAIPSGTPVSGTFTPNNGNLNIYNGESPIGDWQLVAGDDFRADPLCVFSYSVSITVPDPLPALSLVKSVDDDSLVVLGQTLTYSYEVNNTGNISIDDVNLSDVHSGSGTLSAITPSSVNLAPGAGQIFTATYVVTQADIDASSNITNTATATGNPQAGVLTDPTDSESVTVEVAAPALSLVKSVDDDSLVVLGQTLTYSYEVNNTGNISIDDVNLSDVHSGSGTLSAITPSSVNLAPGAGQIFTATYVVTQADIDASSNITNTATATGNPQAGVLTDPTDSESVTVEVAAPALTLSKTGTFIDANGDGYANVGEIIRYDFNVTNAGNVNLTNIRLTDNNAVITGGPIAILLIGQSDTVTFTGEHTIIQQDLIDGRIINQAVVTGTPPVGPDVNASSYDPTTDPIDDPTIIPLDPEPPLANDNNQAAFWGQDTVIDVVSNTSGGAFGLDPTTVRLTAPPGATNIILDPDGSGDAIGFNVPNEGTWSVNVVTGEVTFSPNPDYVGDPTPVEYSIEDTQGNATSAMIRLNFPPVANDDANVTLEAGDTAIFNPLKNDQQTSTPLDPTTINLIVPSGATGTDTDGDGNIDEVDVPGEGVWTAHSDGTVTFLPDNTLIGNPAPLKYTVRETSGDLSNEAIMNVIYRSGSGGPNAVDDGIIPIRHYGPNVIDVLTNDDFGPDGPGTQGIIIVRHPAHGTIGFDDGGTPNDPTDDVLIYEPEPNIPPVTDSFEYMITDASGDTSVATVTLDVNCASTQTSDSGDTLGTISMLMMIFMTIMTGLYLARREEKGNI